MNETAEKVEEKKAEMDAKGDLNKIVKRFGGRHLIFRTKTGGWWITPTPYVLISSFRGPMWVFYGAGQIWLTHKKVREIGGWMARAPRLGSKEVTAILDKIETPIAEFTNYCNEHGIEGTLVVEKKCIEFHWTFGDELELESQKGENASPLDQKFSTLCDCFLEAKSDLGIEE